MKKMKYLKDEILYCLHSLINPGLPLVILMLSFVGNGRTQNITAVDFVINAFLGSRGFESGTITVLTWIAQKSVLIYLIGSYFNNELCNRYKLTILRIKSRTNWMIRINIHIFLLIFFYYLICFIFIGLIGFVKLPHSFIVGPYTKELLNITGYQNMWSFILILTMFLLIVLSTYILALILILIHLISRNPSMGFSIIEIIMFIPIIINGTKFTKYLPETQSILIKHNVSNFTLGFSFIYDFILIVLLIGINIVYVRKNEI